MNNIKKYPVTYTLLALCIMTYIATTLLLSIDMNAMQGLAAGGFNPYYVHVTHQTIDWLRTILFILALCRL